MIMHRITLLAALCAGVLSAQAGTTVTSAPYGAMTANLTDDSAGLAFPLIAKDVFTSLVASNEGSHLEFKTAGLASALVSGEQYYVEIVTGPLEGERFDLKTTPSISSGKAMLDLSNNSNSTSNKLQKNALAGARAVVRPHVTLGKLGAMFSPALVGHVNNLQADGIAVFGDSITEVFYFLRPDGKWSTWPWGPDERNHVIPPDVSVVLMVRSGAKQWTHLGGVRTNVFRKKLRAGLQGFATGFPLDLSPAQVAAFTDPQEPASIRWTGSDIPLLADSFSVYDSANASFKVHYLRGNGTSWYLVGGGNTNLAFTPFLPAQGATVLNRRKADPGYLIIRPFDL